MEFFMKRLFLSLAILGVCSIGIFAQENEMKKNSVGFSFTLFGAELHYERNFNNYLSVLGSVSYTTIFIVDEFTVSAKGRWYPFGKTWYLGLGAGYILGGLSDYNGGLLAGLLTASAYFPPLIIFDSERVLPTVNYFCPSACDWGGCGVYEAYFPGKRAFDTDQSWLEDTSWQEMGCVDRYGN